MENPTNPGILSAERLGDAVIITFDDGKSAIYPAALLYSVLSQAQRVYESDFAEED